MMRSGLFVTRATSSYEFTLILASHQQNKKYMNKTILTLLVGIGIGLLIAPDKGSATIKKLKRKYDDLKDQAQDRIDDLADNTRSAVNTARSKVKSVLD